MYNVYILKARTAKKKSETRAHFRGPRDLIWQSSE